jgi:hypothetical protein
MPSIWTGIRLPNQDNSLMSMLNYERDRERLERERIEAIVDEECSVMMTRLGFADRDFTMRPDFKDESKKEAHLPTSYDDLWVIQEVKEEEKRMKEKRQAKLQARQNQAAENCEVPILIRLTKKVENQSVSFYGKHKV